MKCHPRPCGVLLLALMLTGGQSARAEEARRIDFRFATPYWYTALNRPDDWHKQLADDRGALLYDFGPGPYVKPQTIVEFGVEAGELKRVKQELVSPRVAILRTELAGGGAQVTVETGSVWPSAPAATRNDFGDYQRLDGISGALGWAQPAGGACDSAFRNSAWGTNRPLHYRVKVPAGAKRQVVLGFCESYKTKVNQRIAVMRVEGAETQKTDLAVSGRQNEPQVFLFAARDSDGDGWLEVEVGGQPGADPNTTLSGIWVYAADAVLTRDRMVRGVLDKAPAIEQRILCGRESTQQTTRFDVMRGTFTGDGVVPQVIVRTKRPVIWFAAAGELRDETGSFLRTSPRPAEAFAVPAGWLLTFPPGTPAVDVVVRTGKSTVSWPSSVVRALAKTRAAWEEFDGVPYGAVHVPDAALQALMEAALRPAWQAREVVNGRLQFQPGLTLYRGLWADFTNYGVETAALLGDETGARHALETLWTHRDADGLVTVMKPDRVYRETPETLWLMCRYARRAGDWEFVRKHWPEMRRAMRACWQLREQTLADPKAANYGLMPASFADGGRFGMTAEYSAVFWMLKGLDETARMARVLGQEADAVELQANFTELRAAYEAAAKRDLRRDNHGNRYLPLTVGLKEPEEIPQNAQWGTLEFYSYAGWLPRNDALLKGTVDLHRAVELQGLPVSTGWLRGGIWAGYGLLYARGLLLLGEVEKAADVVYTVANHAAPTGVWVEEQPPVGSTLRLAGDMPHTWHGLELWRVVVMMLALERGEELRLCESLPQAWLAPGAETRLDHVHTIFGELSLKVQVSADGRHATCTVTTWPHSDSAGVRLKLPTAAFARAGFRTTGQADAEGCLALPWGQTVTVEFTR